MKQIAQNYRSGDLQLVDVPIPALRPGGVLVRTAFSLVSVGTELMKVDESKLSLLGKARARPDKVQQVLSSVAQQGAVATYRKAMNQLDSLTPLGYSLCGVVEQVGAGVTDLHVGQRVACAGNDYALHAEYNWVPRNLCVPVPDEVRSEHAAFTTVGAIAMHGFRQSQARLGEVACVIGLGLVGQLLVQILAAAGVRVVGIDLSPERCRLAERLGADVCASPDPSQLPAVSERIAALTSGAGADHILITAGGATNQPVELATRLARDRASVVDVGKTKLDLPWNAWYEKELQLRLSRSYGPGRYDPNYEEGGVDYPRSYVRWTEGRNLGLFLDLVASGSVDLEPLVSEIVPFDDAVTLYQDLSAHKRSGIGFVFRYGTTTDAQRVEGTATLSARIATAPSARNTATPSPAGPVKVGVIGAGNYATSMVLPHLRDADDVAIVEIATATSLSAANAQRRFAPARVSTDYQGLLEDPNVSTVFVLTRHSSHAAIVTQALEAGKAVFVEKPLAVTPEQLARVEQTMERTGNDRIMVGYNRRFAPLLVDLRAAWGTPGGPQQLLYTVNAGRLSQDSWYAQSDEGSRIVGEGCHFVDTVSWWLGAEPLQVVATSTAADADDCVLTLTYPDGSVATVAYLTGGDAGYPKETLQVFGGGRVAALHNFRRTQLWSAGKSRTKRNRLGVDKGQRDELAAFIRAVRRGDPMPIGLGSLLATSRATFAAVRSLGSGAPEPVVAPGPTDEDAAAPAPADSAPGEPVDGAPAPGLARAEQ
jgi:predicted dehydrogenase/threonine dehydrogenase-like Zn-dependent dehydrogenase